MLLTMYSAGLRRSEMMIRINKPPLSPQQGHHRL
jgi:hypothetical protein